MSGLDIAAVRAGLATALDTSTDLKRVFPYIVDRIPEYPAAYVGFAEPVLYNRRFARGAAEATFTVVLVAGRVDTETAQAALDVLVGQASSAGVYVSVKDALESDRTLGGACGTLLVEQADNLRAVQIAGTDYLAVDLTVRTFA